METLNDVGASEFLGIRTLTLSIYSTWINQSNLPGAAQIALVMLVVVVFLVAHRAHGAAPPDVRRSGAAVGTAGARSSSAGAAAGAPSPSAPSRS